MTRSIRTSLLVLALLVAGTALVPPAAGAAVRVGFSEQDLGVFADPKLDALGIRLMRGFAPWNVALSRGDRPYLEAWLGAAAAHGVEPHVTFTAASGSRCPRSPCRLPTVAQYARAFRAFRKRWPWVRVLSPWNEANHRTQPTFRQPRRAAQFYNVVRRACRGCTVVAADVIDEPNMVGWLDEFRRHARRPRLWGLHNYRDVNPRPGQRLGGTQRLLDAVPGQVWLTETGGLVQFGRLFRKSEARADRAVRRLFALARRHRQRIRRIYIYHWRAPAGRQVRFDAGVLRADGTARPAYHTVRRHLGTPLFGP